MFKDYCCRDCNNIHEVSYALLLTRRTVYQGPQMNLNLPIRLYMLDTDYYNFSTVPSIDTVLLLGANLARLTNRMKTLCRLPICLDIFCEQPDKYEINTTTWGTILFVKSREKMETALEIYVNTHPTESNLICIECE